MKHSMFLLILVMIFSPVLPAHQTANRPDSQKISTVMEIEKVREKMLEALNNHDFETMEKLYSEHYTWVSWKGDTGENWPDRPPDWSSLGSGLAFCNVEF